MEKINKNWFGEDIDMETEPEFDAEQYLSELKSRINIDKDQAYYKPTDKKHWGSVAYDAAQFRARVGFMTRIAQNTCTMINMYLLCYNAGDPITSKEYIEMTKNNVAWFFAYYSQFKDVEREAPTFFDIAVGDKEVTAKHYANLALRDSVKFLKHLEEHNN